MNNENGELSDVKTQKNPTKQLRKPVKRLNAEIRGVVTPENSPKKLGNSATAPAVESRHNISRRSSISYKNFLGKFRRSNPGRLTVEASSIWLKMSLQEKEQFRANLIYPFTLRVTGIKTRFKEILTQNSNIMKN